MSELPGELMNVIELYAPLKPGARVEIRGVDAMIFEVKRLDSVATTGMLRNKRHLFAVVHAGPGGAFLAVLLDERDGPQTEWKLFMGHDEAVWVDEILIDRMNNRTVDTRRLGALGTDWAS